MRFGKAILLAHQVTGIVPKLTFSRFTEIQGLSGISSMLPFPIAEESSSCSGNLQPVVLGHKNGSLTVIELVTGCSSLEQNKSLCVNGPIANFQVTENSPVFSLSLDLHGDRLFCGSGDRLITVINNCSSKERVFNTRPLGPHTGWVKALQYEDSTQLLHGIGCNCIETYKHVKNEWVHISKASIESEPHAASLSSDLLCLCSLPNSGGRFVAGGVDGRLHLWQSSAHHMKAPLDSTTAHQGRLNAVSVCSHTELMATGSHDGWVKLWSAPADRLVRDPLADWNAGSGIRVTALTWVDDKMLAIGTNEGEVHLLAFDGETNTFSIVASHKPSEKSIVNCLCVTYLGNSNSKERDRLQIAVGHSKGLSIISLDGKMFKDYQ